MSSGFKNYIINLVSIYSVIKNHRLYEKIAEVFNMDAETKQFLANILSELKDIGYVKPEEIPNIDLYMDQVTTFIESHLAPSNHRKDGKILTKTMINNYAKNDLLPPPEKKKYSKEHMLTLIFIYYFKNIMSISDIQTVLNPITDKYFGKTDSDLHLTDIYNEVFSLEYQETKNIMKDLAKKFTKSTNTFEGVSEEDAAMLHRFSLICLLSYDIYIKKTIIEDIVDQINHEKSEKHK